MLHKCERDRASSVDAAIDTVAAVVSTVIDQLPHRHSLAREHTHTHQIRSTASRQLAARSSIHGSQHRFTHLSHVFWFFCCSLLLSLIIVRAHKQTLECMCAAHQLFRSTFIICEIHIVSRAHSFHTQFPINHFPFIFNHIKTITSSKRPPNTHIERFQPIRNSVEHKIAVSLQSFASCNHQQLHLHSTHLQTFTAKLLRYFVSPLRRRN